MRIDFFRLSQLVWRAQRLLRAQQAIPKGDAGLYLILRSLLEQLERANPGIAGAAGFDFALSVLGNIPGDPWGLPTAGQGPPTGPLG